MKKKGKILVVDDNEEILVALRLFLLNHFEGVTTEKNPEMIGSRMQKDSYDVIILDMNFKAGINTGNEGLFWLKKILELDKAVSVVFITAYAGIELAVNAIKQGAVDFIEKPWDDDKLLATVLKAFEVRRSKLEINRLRETGKKEEDRKPDKRAEVKKNVEKEPSKKADGVASTRDMSREKKILRFDIDTFEAEDKTPQTRRVRDLIPPPEPKLPPDTVGRHKTMKK